MRLLASKSATLVPSLQIIAWHTEHVAVLLVGLSGVTYYLTIADKLLAPSDSREINFFSTALTVVARSSTVQLCAKLEVARSRF